MEATEWRVWLQAEDNRMILGGLVTVTYTDAEGVRFLAFMLHQGMNRRVGTTYASKDGARRALVAAYQRRLAGAIKPAASPRQSPAVWA